MMYATLLAAHKATIEAAAPTTIQFIEEGENRLSFFMKSDDFKVLYSTLQKNGYKPLQLMLFKNAKRVNTQSAHTTRLQY